MRNKDQINGWIGEAEKGIAQIAARTDLRFPELPIAEYKAQIACLKWVLNGEDEGETEPKKHPVNFWIQFSDGNTHKDVFFEWTRADFATCEYYFLNGWAICKITPDN